MRSLDWAVMIAYVFVLLGIAFWACKKVRSSEDFYIGGGKVPWWLAGASHHVSGYSAVVFTGYAAIAYRMGFTIYVWWACPIALAMFIGSVLIAPRWVRLRQHLGVQSPTGYLSRRYNIATQQLIAWSGVVLKLLDVAAKWVAIALVLNGFTGLDMKTGILMGSVLSIVYITVGGFWADLANDFFQFVVQILAGCVMFVVVVRYLGGFGEIRGALAKLPAEHFALFPEPYNLTYVLLFSIVVFMSYNGGTWNLAMRFISTTDPREAKRTAQFSAVLYLLWPLVLFFPMWMAPLIFPGMENPQTVYSLMAQKFLPAGLFGLVLAGMVSATLTMTASDTNAISAVLTKDIFPVLFPRSFSREGGLSLFAARATTVIFTVLTVIIAFNNQRFGGIIGLIVSWFGALLGPSATPMLLGLLPFYRHCGPSAASGLSLSSRSSPSRWRSPSGSRPWSPCLSSRPSSWQGVGNRCPSESSGLLTRLPERLIRGAP